MKKKWIILITIISIFLVVGTGLTIFFVSSANEKTVTFDDNANVDDYKYVTTLKKTPEDGSNPSNYDALTNVYYSLYNLEHKEAFSCVTTGQAKAAVATQIISNSRVVIGDKAMVSTISDGIIKVGTQKYFVEKNGNVLLRTAQSINDAKAVWKTEEPECITSDAYLKQYGWLPYKAIGYIICDDTVLEVSELKCENGIYETTLTLDPDGEKAPYWYRREVATNGSSTMIPEFSLIKLTYKFDSNWNIIEVHAQEKYLVKSMGIKTTCETNCYDKYSYDNVFFDEDSYNFFKKYETLSAKSEKTITKDDALTMLTSSLINNDNYESLGVSIKFNDELVEGIASIDITDLSNVKVKVLAEDLFLEYSDSLYISLGDLKVKSDISYLKDLLNEFNGTIPNVDAIDTAAILAAFDNADIKEENNESIVKVKFNLFGYDINLEYSIYKDDVDYILNYVVIDSLVNGNKVEITAHPSQQAFPSVDKTEFNDLSNIDYIFEFFSKLILNKKAEALINIDYNDLKATIDLKGDFRNSLKINANVNIDLNSNNYLINITYIDDSIYLNYNDINLMITKDDLLKLINKYSTKANKFNNIEATNIIETIMNLDFDLLLKEVIIENNSLTLTTNLEQLVGMSKDIIIKLSDGEGSNIDILVDKLNVSGKIYIPDEIEINKKDANYSNLTYLEGFIDDVLLIVNSKKLKIDLNAKYENIDIDGYIKLDLTDLNNLKAEALINLNKNNNIKNIKLTYLNDNIYIDFEGEKLSISIDSIFEILNKFDVNLPKSDNPLDILKNIDFNKIINSLILEENKLELGLDLSDLISILKDLKISLSNQNNSLNININKYDLNMNLYTFDDDIIIDGSYLSLDNLVSYTDDIKSIIDSKKLEAIISLNIKDIDVLGNVKIDFNDLENIKAKASLTLSKDNKNIDLTITYLNNVIYADILGQKLSLSKEALLQILNKFDIDLSNTNNLIDELFKLDFNKIINELKLENNNILLDLNLSDINSNLSNLNLIISDDEKIKIESNLYDLKLELNSNEFEIALDGEYKSIDNVSNYIDNIKDIINNKKISANLNAKFENIDISGIVNLDFNDLENIKANALIDLKLKDNTISLKAKYLNDVIYLDFAGQKLSLSKDALFEILTKFDIDLNNSKDLINEIFNLDFNSIIKNLEMIEDEINLGLDLSSFIKTLSDLEIVVTKLNENINLKANKYNLSLDLFVNDFEIEASGTYKELDDINLFIDNIKDIIDNKKLKLDILAKYKDINIDGYALIDFTKDLKAYLNINILYKDINIPVEIHYVDNLIYLDYKDIHGYISLDNLLNIFDIKLIDPIELLFNIKYDKLIEDINIDNDINLSLNLDYLLNDILGLDLNLGSINAKVINDNSIININSDIIDELNIDIYSNFDDEIKLDAYTYINLDSILSSVYNIFKNIDKKSFRLDIDANLNISNFVSLLSNDINIDGYVDFLYDNGYKINANLHVQYDKITTNINIKYQDEYLYINAIGINIKLGINELDSLIKEVMNKFEIDDSNLNISKDSILTKAFDVVETILLVNENTISIDLNKILDKLSILTIILLNNNENYSLNLNMDILNCDINISNIDNYELIYQDEYLGYDDILNLCDMVAEILNISKNKEFNLNLDFSVYDQGSKHLDVKGNLEFKIYENGKFDLHAEGTITQYENNVTKYHIIDLYLITKEYYGTDTAKYMVYLTYGTIPNSSSKIKVYLPLTEVLDIAGTLSKLLGVDLSFLDKYSSFNFNDIDTTQVENLIKDDILGKVINLDKIIKSFNAEEGRLVLGLNINDLLAQPENNTVSLVIDTNDRDNVIASLSLKNLYTVYHSISENTMFDINNITLVNDPVDIKVPNTNGYYNITEIEKLVNGLITTATFKDFEIQGEAKLNMLGFKLITLPIDIKINVAEDGKPIIHAYIDASNYLAKTAFSTKKLDIYFKDGYVYIKKLTRYEGKTGLLDKDSDTYYLKISQQTFLDDLVHYLLEFALGAKDIVMNNVNKDDGNDNHIIDAGNVLNSYSHSGNNFTLGLNLEELTGNSMLGDANFTLGLQDVITNNETKEKNLALTSLKNLQVSLLGFINLTMESLSISNIDSSGNVKAVDNSDLDTFITNYNKTKKTDVKYINNSEDETISHKITFVKGIAGENIVITGITNNEIIFPTIVPFEYNGEVYNFVGWYTDKDLTKEFSLTKFDDDNHKLYAKYVKA